MRRRTLLAAGVAAALARRDADATPADVRQAVALIAGSATVRDGRVHVEIAPLVENGNSVPLAVRVDSPMTADDHVKAIHVFVERNPQPFVATFRIGPRAGRAAVSTRIRLADSQSVVALCEASDGSFWQGSASAIVTLAACSEEI